MEGSQPVVIDNGSGVMKAGVYFKMYFHFTSLHFTS
jgi:hypothetical protein